MHKKVDDMKKNCETDLKNKHVEWFFDIMKNHFNNEQRSKMLHFFTGYLRGPPGGFKELEHTERGKLKISVE